jgi:hypothetical protein
MNKFDLNRRVRELYDYYSYEELLWHPLSAKFGNNFAETRLVIVHSRTKATEVFLLV